MVYVVSGYGSAVLYGYSNTYIKAVESKLINKTTMQNIINAKDIPSILLILINTDYKKNLIDFGGLNIKLELIDFALSKNFGEKINKLMNVTPLTKKYIMRQLIGKWDLYNIKLALEARHQKKDFSSISKYLIDYGAYSSLMIKQTMQETIAIEDLLQKFIINSPYKNILQQSLQLYKKNQNILEVNIGIDKNYYENLSKLLFKMNNIDHNTYFIIKKEIDMKNVISLLRAKKHNLNFNYLEKFIIENGNLDKEKLRSIFEKSSNVEDLVTQIKIFEIKSQLNNYLKTNDLLYFEIKMKHNILDTSSKILKHTTLSFGSIYYYLYLKEIEISTIRLLLKAKQYNLDKQELSQLIQ